MSMQTLFNNVCTNLRQNGNPYGSSCTRGWSWINPDDPSQRCAIAQCFTEVKFDSMQLFDKIEAELGLSYISEVYDHKLVNKILELYDCYSSDCNKSVLLEQHLKRIARDCDLTYTPVAVGVEIVEPKASLEVSDVSL